MLTNSLEVAVAERTAAHKNEVPEAVIAVAGLQKSYGGHEAVRGLDLEVRRGEIFAFLGPNGAGKTTTVEILEGFRKATAGSVRVLGADPATSGMRWRERLGIVPQETAAEPGLSVRECVEMYAGYYRHPRPVDETLDLVGLGEAAEQRAQSLSGGQQRRLDVALALIGDPELVFLDEPTTGFDPAARRAAWEVIDGLRALGKTVFLTTHYMEEAERLADRIAVIAGGRIIAEGTPGSLGGRDLAEAEISFGGELTSLPAELAARASSDREGRVVIHSRELAGDLHALSGWALQRGLGLDDLTVARPSLEDTYLALVASDDRS